MEQENKRVKECVTAGGRRVGFSSLTE